MSNPPPSGPFPLSPIQQGILYHTVGAPGLGAYNSQTVQELDGHVDAACLERAWARVAARHDAFRTEFLLDGDEPQQRVVGDVPIPFQLIDVSDAPPGVQERQLEEVTADWVRDFDLTRAPLFRVHLLRLTPTHHVHVAAFHHLVMDGWSWEVVLEDLWAAYLGELEGRPVELGPAPSYRAYVEWIAAQDLARAERTFRARLAGFDAPTPIGARHAAAVAREPGAASPFARRAEQRSTLDEGVTDGLRETARRAGCSLAAVVAGAWGLALGRAAGVDEVVFGLTLAGRRARIPNVSRLVGVLVNTLPLRLPLPGALPADAWLAEVGTRVLELQQHESTPLARVQEWSELGRGVPLFETTLVFQNQVSQRATDELDRRRGFRVSEYEDGLEHDTIVLVVTPSKTTAIQARFDASRISGPELDRLLFRFEAALRAFAAAPVPALRALDLATAAERRFLTARVQTARAWPDAPATLHEAFERQVDRTPEAVAVVFGSTQLTYAELDRRASGLARRLRAVGVGPEVRVALIAERSAELVIALCAVLKAGGAHVPIDPALADARIGFFVADVGARVILADPSVVPRVAGLAPVVLCLPEVTQDEAPRTTSPVSPGQLAYVIYTSGANVQPRPTMSEHAAVLDRLAWMHAEVPLTADDVVLHKCPSVFDVSVWELLWPLLAGARVVVARPGGHADPRYLAELIAAAGVTTVHFVPSMLSVFLDELEPGQGMRLTRVFCSGEVLSAELARRFHERLPAVELHTFFGPTEGALGITSRARPRAGPGARPMGRPIANAALHVTTAALELALPGVPGELCVGGLGVGRGYLGRPELTAERFVPDPFGATPGARLFRTGERVRWNEAGELEHLAPLEVRARPGSRRATLGAGPGKPAGKRLLTAGKAFTASDTRAEAGTPAGRPFLAPEGEAEVVLAEVWAQVLGLERVGAEEDFYALGGDSIRSIQVASRARRRGVQVSSVQLFENPTVRTLARVARRVAIVAAAEQAPLAGACALSPIVRWFLEDAPSDHFNQAVLLVARTRVTLDVVERAARAIVDHHDALRLRLRRAERSSWTVAGTTAWFEAPGPGNAPVDQVDLTHVRDAELAAALADHGSAAQARLELGHGPVTRLVLFELGPTRPQRLLWIAHHVAVDAGSWEILVSDLRTALAAVLEGRPVVLAEKTTSVRAWVGALEAEARRLEADPRVWATFEPPPGPGLPASSIPPGPLRSVVRTVASPATHARRPEELVLAAVVEAVTRWAAVDRLLVDVEGHGRDPVGGVSIDRTVGWFTTIHPVLVARGTTFDATVAATGAALAPSRLAPQAFGVLRHLGSPTSRSRLDPWAAAPVLFNFLGAPFGADASGPIALATEGTGAAEDAARRSRYLLVVGAARVGDRLELELSSGRLDDFELGRLADAALALLAVEQAPSRPTPSDFPLAGLSADELAALLGGAS